MITQTYNIDLVPNGKPLIVNVSQYDKLSRTLEFNVYSGGVLFEIPSGTAAVIQGTKIDDTGFSYNMTVSTSKVSMDIEQQMTVFDGDVHCEIVFTKNAEQLGSANFILRVEKAAISDETIISETDIPIFRSFASGGSEGQVFVHGEGNEGAWRTVGTGSGVWGQITGTMSDQTDLQNALNGKQETLTAGENITIVNNVISSTGGSGASEWGDITGTLSNQSDLQNALDEKIDKPSSGTVGQVLTKTATGSEWDDVNGLPSGGTTGQVLTKASSTDGDATWQTSSVQWGNIAGTLANQTDLNNTLNSKMTTPSGGSTGQFLQKTSNGTQWANAGNVDTVNGISPDAQKNVQVDVELTKAQYDALPSSKLTDDVNYWIKDGTDIPAASVISASGVQYDNSQSGMTADDVQDAVDELKSGLTNVTNRVNNRARVLRFGGSSVTSYKIECINAYQILLIVANTGTRLFMVNPNNGSPIINMFAGSGITVEGLNSLSFNLNNCPTYTQFMVISYDDFSVTNN